MIYVKELHHKEYFERYFGKVLVRASVMSYSPLALNRILEGIVLWWLIVISVWVINFN